MICRRKLRNGLIKAIMGVFSFLTVGFLLWLLLDMILKGLPHVSLKFIFTEYNEYKGLYGIAPMMVTTLWMISLTLMIAMPIGIFSAVYLVEYSDSDGICSVIRFAAGNLAGIPSILFGLFGYIFFKNYLKLGFSLLSGSLTLAVMVLPSIIKITEEALLSVDPMYRTGSRALGATRLHTLYHIILPCAVPQILSAVLLSIGRVIGETAAVYFTAGTVYRFPEGVMSSGRTLAVHLYMLAKETGNFQDAYATALLLIILTALIHCIVSRMARVFMRNRSGNV